MSIPSGFTQISAGFAHTCAIISGTAMCWGGDGGDLGTGSFSIDSPVPVPVFEMTAPPGVGGVGPQQISAGYRHTCATINYGQIECWGSNSVGELGNGTKAGRDTPGLVIGLITADTQLGSEGGGAGCGLTAALDAMCWGVVSGNGTFTPQGSAQTVLNLPPSDVANIAAGQVDVCVLLIGGSVECWGLNDFGEVGDGPPIRRWPHPGRRCRCRRSAR